jgi:hypothetical protein
MHQLVSLQRRRFGANLLLTLRSVSCKPGSWVEPDLSPDDPRLPGVEPHRTAGTHTIYVYRISCSFTVDPMFIVLVLPSLPIFREPTGAAAPLRRRRPRPSSTSPYAGRDPPPRPGSRPSSRWAAPRAGEHWRPHPSSITPCADRRPPPCPGGTPCQAVVHCAERQPRTL